MNVPIGPERPEIAQQSTVVGRMAILARLASVKSEEIGDPAALGGSTARQSLHSKQATTETKVNQQIPKPLPKPLPTPPSPKTSTKTLPKPPSPMISKEPLPETEVKTSPQMLRKIIANPQVRSFLKRLEACAERMGLPIRFLPKPSSSKPLSPTPKSKPLPPTPTSSKQATTDAKTPPNKTESHPHAASTPTTSSTSELATTERARAASTPMTPAERRESVFSELRVTERSFHESLKKATLQLGTMSKILDEEKKADPFLEKMTGVYRDLSDLSFKIAEKLDKASTPDELKAIYASREFKEYARLTTIIIVNYQKLLKTGTKFSKEHKQLMKHNEILNPESLKIVGVYQKNLITPMQRLLRLPLLLGSMQETFGKENKEIPEELIDARKSVLQAADAAQEAKIQSELSQKINDFLRDGEKALSSGKSKEFTFILKEITNFLGLSGLPEDLRSRLTSLQTQINAKIQEMRKSI